MSWYVLVIGWMIFQTASDTLRRVVLSGTHKINYYSAAFLLSVVTTISLLVYTLSTRFIMPPIGSFKLLFVINISMGIIGLLTYQVGLSHLGVGEFTILMTTRQIITWLASLVLLGAGLTLIQGLGSVLIMAALIIVFFNKRAFKQHSRLGLSFTLITAVLYGLAFIVDLLIYRKSDPASYLVFGYGLTALILPIIKPRVLHDLKLLNFTPRGFGILLMGVCTATSNIMLFTALKRANNAPLVSGLMQLQIILAVIFGIFLLKERERIMRKFIGAVMAVLGAVMIVR